MPTDRTNASPAGSSLRIIWGLFGISVVGLAFGAFVLPNMLPAAAGSLPPHYDPGLIQTGDAPGSNIGQWPNLGWMWRRYCCSYRAVVAGS